MKINLFILSVLMLVRPKQTSISTDIINSLIFIKILCCIMLSRLYYHKGNENHPNFKTTCTSRALYQGVIHKNYDRVTFLMA